MRPAANFDPVRPSSRRRAAARRLVIEGEVLRSSSQDRMAANENRAGPRRAGPWRLPGARLASVLRGIGRAAAALLGRRAGR